MISISIALTFLLAQCHCDYTDDAIGEYEKLIYTSTEKARAYVFPENNTNYEPIDDTTQDFGQEFDIIIVGGGTTGATAAARISEESSFRVLLLEAGDYGNNLTEITRMSYDAYILSDYNWGYYSVPQKTACLGMAGSKCAHPRGKGMGGTSLLNALIYVRGNKEDFNLWANMGNPGWSFKDVLPYFKKSENFQSNLESAPIDWRYHAQGGPWNVEYPIPISPQTKVFFEASSELGYNYTDVNGEYQTGHMPFQINTKKGRRQDSATAFIDPIEKERKNLVILTKAFVTKILINRYKQAYGVLFTYKGVLYRALAKKEVIVCAGAINSPQLLMLSGVGPKNHLSQFGITTYADLQVGSHFSDHLQVYGLSFRSNLTEPVQSMREQVNDYLHGKGLLGEALSSQAVGYYETPLANMKGYPDLEISFFNSNSTTYALSKFQNWDPVVTEAMGVRTKASDFGIFVTALHTKSRGTVRLQSASPYDFPLINPNCMTDPEGHDIALVYEGIQFAIKLTETNAFKKINATLNIRPLKYCKNKFNTRAYWYCVIRYITAHNNHPVSTCKMGPDPSKGDVVDYRMRVHGIKGLRVADASVIPLSTSSHINAICIMIGEKLADILKMEYGGRKH